MKYRCLTWLLATLALASCASDTSVVEKLSQRDAHTLTATIGNDAEGTKTVVENGGTKVLWNTGEEVSVFLKGTNYKFTSQNTEQAATARFKGTPNLSEIGEGNPVWALSPYRSDAKISGQKITFEIPGVQKAVDGTCDPDAHALAAWSTTTDLSFRNITGGLRFTLKQEGITGITLKGNDGEILAGNVDVIVSAASPQVDNVASPVKSITLQAPAGGFKTGVWYYITTIPLKFTKGFTVDFEAGANSASFTTSQSVSVSRGAYGSITEIDRNLVFEAPVVKVESVSVEPAAVTLDIGATATLTAKVLPEDATDKTITWSSGNEKVATVDGKGVVKAVSQGTAFIVALTNDGFKTATCKVTVNPPSYDMIAGELESATDTSSIGGVIHYKYGTKWGPTANKFMVIAYNRTAGKPIVDKTASHFKCSSSNPSVVKVAVEDVGRGIRGFSVTVLQNPTDGDEAFSNLSFTYTDDDGNTVTKTTRLVIAPGSVSNAFTYTLRFFDSVSGFVDVSAGEFTHVLPTAGNSYSTLSVGYDTGSRIYPIPETKAMMRSLSFTSSNSSVVAVEEDTGNAAYGAFPYARITYKKTGTSTVTVKYTDYKGNVFSKSVTIHVVPSFAWQSGDIASNSTNPRTQSSPYYLKVGTTVEIRAYKGNAEYTALEAFSLQWSSTNANFATVSPARGNKTTVTGTGAGLVEIKATDSKGVARSWWAYVYVPVSSVTPKPTLVVGVQSNLSRKFAAGTDFTLNPSNATTPQSYGWYSTNTSVATVTNEGLVSVTGSSMGTATIQVKPSPPNSTWFDARTIKKAYWNVKCLYSSSTSTNALKVGDTFTTANTIVIDKNKSVRVQIQNLTDNVMLNGNGYRVSNITNSSILKNVMAVYTAAEGHSLQIGGTTTAGTSKLTITYDDGNNYFSQTFTVQVQ